MKLKKISSSKKIRLLERQVRELALDVQAITNEHNLYVIPMEKGEAWYTSLPIESLFESIAKDRGLPRQRMSLMDLKHKFELKRLHEQTVLKLQLAKSDLEVAKIDSILEKIEKI